MHSFVFKRFEAGSFSGGGHLIDASIDRMLFYFANSEDQKHFLKILDRRTGLATGQIDLEEFSYLTKMIKIDSLANIVLKLNQNTLIKYYDSCGLLLNDFVNTELNKLNTLVELNLTRDDQIVHFDKSSRKVYILWWKKCFNIYAFAFNFSFIND